MARPDPDFVRFFDNEFPRRLDAVEVPGMEGASWDRKAAWLLYRAERRAPTSPATYDPDIEDLL